MSYTISSNISGFLSAENLEAFLDGYIATDDIDLGWLRMQTTNLNQVVNHGLNTVGQYNTQTEGQAINTEALSSGFQATYTHNSVSYGFALSRQSNLTMDASAKVDLINQLGQSSRRRMASDAYSILNDATSTNGPDGTTLAATDHPSAVGDMDNSLTSDLDFAGLEVAQRTLMLQQSHDGILLGNRATVLIVPPAKRAAAFQTTQADFESADLGLPSIAKSFGLRVIVAADLDDSSRWFLIDEKTARLNMYILQGPQPQVVEIASDSYNFEVTDLMIYSTGFDTWRGLVSSSA